MEDCPTNHGMILASWEQNKDYWASGHHSFEFGSKIDRTQRVVGKGGTLWVIVSRPASTGGRLYTLSYCLRDCTPITYDEEHKFGRYSIRGDSEKSRFFAETDARLLLLAMRFAPEKPINGAKDNQISNSLTQCRCLCKGDIELLENYVRRLDAWSVFISYRRIDHTNLATTLSERIQDSGVSVFRDEDALKAGDKWWDVITDAISRTRRFVVLIGPTTHESEYVVKEVRLALQNNKVIIPVLAGGRIEDWGELAAPLKEFQFFTMKGEIDDLVTNLIEL